MSNLSKSNIRGFLKDWCDEEYEMPFSALELLMDNHRFITWGGKSYFMPEGCSMWSSIEEEIAEHLYFNFCE